MPLLNIKPAASDEIPEAHHAWADESPSRAWPLVWLVLGALSWAPIIGLVAWWR